MSQPEPSSDARRPGDLRGWPSGAPADGVWRGCGAWSLLLADAEDPSLVDIDLIKELPADDGIVCSGRAAYSLDLDESVWSWPDVALCVEHTAQIRALPHGGIKHIHQLVVVDV